MFIVRETAYKSTEYHLKWNIRGGFHEVVDLQYVDAKKYCDDANEILEPHETEWKIIDVVHHKHEDNFNVSCLSGKPSNTLRRTSDPSEVTCPKCLLAMGSPIVCHRANPIISDVFKIGKTYNKKPNDNPYQRANVYLDEKGLERCISDALVWTDSTGGNFFSIKQGG